MSARIVFEEGDDGVASVALSHPGKFNAMSRAMWRELRAGFECLQSSASLRCVLIKGESGHFCAGGDISEYADFRFQEESLRTFHEDDVWGGLQAMLDCDVPIVAQIEGNCMGAGIEIASCCDIRIASTAARFGAPIARLGFPMAPRETELVLREAGALTVREMLLEAAVFDAAQMLNRGFLNRIVAVEQCAPEAMATAQRVATLAPAAARMNKQYIRAFHAQNSLPTLAEYALPAIHSIATMTQQAYRYADSPEHREGIAAFVEKRKPVF
ncbi:MAG: enoyl-CoA hydratase/isomerase family protein [Rhodoferax sp.]|nr:enoyl-CoA hydratase/isomerase family protein [Rhodoferax sp.]